MIGIGTKLYSIFANKCPKCHKGDAFVSNNPSKKMLDMNKNCAHCGFRFEKETGFYYGAMYISYALNIALFVSFLVAYNVLLENYISGTYLMLIYVALTVVLMPIYFRLSRMIWLNIFEDYDPNFRQTV